MTDQKRLLSTLRTGTHMIEASAGTGKTYTITGLISAAIALGIAKPSRILAVTFTRAATADLRVRVRERMQSIIEELRKSSPEDPFAIALLNTEGADANNLISRLRNGLEDADSITVDTIHGWCSTIIDRYGDILDIEPVLQDESGLGTSVVEQLVERGAIKASQTSSAEEWIGFSNRVADPKGMARIAQTLLAGAKDIVVAADGDELKEISIDKIKTQLDRFSTAWRAEGNKFEDTLRAAISDNVLKANIWKNDKLEARLESIRQVADGLWYMLFSDATTLDSFRFFGTESINKGLKKGQDINRYPDISDAIDTIALSISQLVYTKQSTLYSFVEAIKSAVPRKPDSFDDVLRLVADKVGSSDKVAEIVRDSADLVLLDESQDTDPLQWKIFSSLFSQQLSKTLIFVGDPKQSIYRFRNADIDIYLSTRDSADSDVFTLDTNYRSDAKLVEAVNGLYSFCSNPFGESIEFSSVKAFRQEPRLTPEISAPLRFIYVPEDYDQSGYSDISTMVADATADDIARHLRNSKKNGPYIKDNDGEQQARSIQPRDCAVLVASNAQAKRISASLSKLGIHSVAAGRSAVTSSPIAVELSFVLNAIDRYNDRSAIRRAALTSIVRPAIGLGRGSTPDYMLSVLDGEQGIKLELALKNASLQWHENGIMNAWRSLDIALNLSLHMAESDDAERRLTDIRHLLELLSSQKSLTDASPSDTVRWLQDHNDSRSPEQIEAEELEERLESDEDAVRILTMHSSKGLEFPLVWIPFAWARAVGSSPQVSNPVIRKYDSKAGDIKGIIVPLDGNKKKNPIVEAEDDALTQEKQRLLYVAITRAKSICTVFVAKPYRDIKSQLSELFDVKSHDVWNRVAELSRTCRGIEASIASPYNRETTERSPEESSLTIPKAEAWTRDTPIDTRWRRGSFSELTSGRHNQSYANTLQPIDSAEDPAADEVDIYDDTEFEIDNIDINLASLPSGKEHGRNTGNAIHQILENMMAGTVSNADSVGRAAFEANGLDPALWNEELTAQIDEIMSIPIKGLASPEPSLNDLSKGTKFAEFRFDMTVASNRSYATVDAHELSSVFSDFGGGMVQNTYAQDIRRLPFVPLRGFLTGSIDLAAQFNNKWLIVDYKSNFLGNHLNNYDERSLSLAMHSHHYILQYHLYLVALHRFLRMRIADYSYDTHVMGAAYLFVRGISASKPGYGVFADKPPLERIEALSDLLKDGFRRKS